MPRQFSQAIAKARRALGLAIVLLALVINVSISAAVWSHESRIHSPSIDIALVPLDCLDTNGAAPHQTCSARILAVVETTPMPVPRLAVARVFWSFDGVAMVQGLANPKPLRPPQYLPAQI